MWKAKYRMVARLRLDDSSLTGLVGRGRGPTHDERSAYNVKAAGRGVRNWRACAIGAGRPSRYLSPQFVTGDGGAPGCTRPSRPAGSRRRATTLETPEWNLLGRESLRPDSPISCKAAMAFSVQRSPILAPCAQVSKAGHSVRARQPESIRCQSICRSRNPHVMAGTESLRTRRPRPR